MSIDDEMTALDGNGVEIAGLNTLLNIRLLKDKFLDPNWLEGPGLDIMVSLYSARRNNSGLCAEELCQHIGSTPRIVIRYLEYYAQSGMIDDPIFPLTSRTVVGLTSDAAKRMKEFLKELSIRSQIG